MYKVKPFLMAKVANRYTQTFTNSYTGYDIDFSGKDNSGRCILPASYTDEYFELYKGGIKINKTGWYKVWVDMSVNSPSTSLGQNEIGILILNKDTNAYIAGLPMLYTGADNTVAIKGRYSATNIAYLNSGEYLKVQLNASIANSTQMIYERSYFYVEYLGKLTQ